MSNILGEPFANWVKNQITYRQSVLGTTTEISEGNLKYLHNKTAWIRVASSVNISNFGEGDGDYALEKLLKYGYPKDQILEENLAKNIVLFSGVIDNSNSNHLSYGLNYQNKTFGNSYGWGGRGEKGYEPPPGIISISQNQYNRGALSKITLHLKCYTREQFQLLELMYMRIGYTLLVEWGWSMYLDKDGKLKSFTDFNTTPFRNLWDVEMDQYKLYNNIQLEREKYRGNYDGVLGKIYNYNWNLNVDGSYDIRVELIGSGDLIESLTINVPPIVEDPKTPLTEIDGNFTSPPPIVADKDATELNKRLYAIYMNSLNAEEGGVGGFHISKFSHPLNGDIPFTFDSKNGIYMIKDVTTESSKSTTSQGYLTFGCLLAIIQHTLLLYDDSKSNKSLTPILYFDVDFKDLDKDKNYIRRFPGQFSADPSTCLIPIEAPNFTNQNLDVAYEKLLKLKVFQQLKNGAHWKKGEYLGRLMNIYLNVEHIALTLNNLPLNESGEVKIITFLNQIIKDITISLGGFNKISIHSSPEGAIRFIEEIPQVFDEGEPYSNSEYTKINLMGVSPNQGSFARNIGISSTIPKSFTHIALAGAQRDGNNSSFNSTSFSNYNLGLEDRIFKVKKSKEETLKETPPELTEDEKINLELQYIQKLFYSKLNNNLGSMFKDKRNWNDEEIISLTSNNIKYSTMVLDKLSKIGPNQQLPGNFFIPFNISLTLDGISGLKIYQKFNMDKKVMPLSYDAQDFGVIITSLSQKVTTQGWETTIEGLPYPNLSNLNKIPNTSSHNKQNSQFTSTVPIFINENIPPPTGDSLTRREAMLVSYNAIFEGRPLETFSSGRITRGIKYECGKWTYNLANKYYLALKGENVNKLLISGGNDANSRNIANNLNEIKYEKVKVLGGVPKINVINKINNMEFGYGDIVMYQSLDGRGSWATYGHAQIYVGDINGSKWATSYDDNFGTSFVYKGEEYDGTQWDLHVYRAPSEII